MGGKFSRDKGRRAEYLVRDLLRVEGYVADRVPLSGASHAYKGDIRFSKDGKVYLAEVKVRAKGAFTRIYEAFSSTVLGGVLGVLDGDGRAATIASTATLALEASKVDLIYKRHPEWAKAETKLFKLQELLGEADILVIKEDHKPFLFIKYENTLPIS